LEHSGLSPEMEKDNTLNYNQCEYTATQTDNLKKDQQNNHEHGKHSCNKCDYQAKKYKTS